MQGFCMSRSATRIRARVHSRIRVRSPSQQYKKTESESGNRVMVLIDSSPEAKVALEWALSHTVQSQDTIILLHVAKQDGKTNGEINRRAYDLLRSTKSMCQLKRPEVHVEMAVREGKEKEATIVEEAKRLRISLLVLGHRKPSFLRQLQMIWASKRTRSRVVDYMSKKQNSAIFQIMKAFYVMLHPLAAVENLELPKL